MNEHSPPPGDVHPDDIGSRIEALEQTDLGSRDRRAEQMYDVLRRMRRVPAVHGGRAWFFYYGTAEHVEVVGDWTCWRESQPLRRVPGTRLFVAGVSFPATARLQYKLIVDGEFVIDPGNARLSREGFGVNSEFWMEGYLDRSWLMPPFRRVARGTLSEVELRSDVMGEQRRMVLYTPVGAGDGGALPLLLVHDGDEALEIGEFDRILDHLIAARQIPPVAAIFLPPVHRNEEYALNVAYERFSVREVLPWAITWWAQHDIAISRQSQDRCVLGASLGGLLAMVTALRHPIAFGACIAQSPAFWWNRGEIFNTSYIHNAPKLRIVLQTGTVCDARELTRIMYQKLRLAGADVAYQEYEQGHTWGNWRTNLAAGVTAWIGRAETVRIPSA